MEGLNLVFMQAEVTDAFVALEAQVHLLSDELAEAAALVVHEGRLVGRELKH